MTTRVEQTESQDLTRAGAMQTVRRGMSLSPELTKGLWATVGLALVAAVGRVINPVVIQQVLDAGLTEGGIELGFVVQMVLYALLAVAITAGATGWMHVRLARVSEAALSGIRIRAFRHIHDLSMLHQASEQRGVLVARVTSDVDQISRFMQWAGLMLIVNAGQALMALIVMFVYSIPLALTVVASIPIIVVMIRFFQTRLEVAYLIVREKVGRMLGTLGEVVVGAQVIRAYGVEDRTRAKLGHVIEDHRQAAVKAGGLSAAFSGASEFLSSVVLAAVLIVGTILAINGSVSIGTVIAFLFLVQLFIQPLHMLGEAVNEAQTAVAGWRRVLDILDMAPDVADPGPDGVDLPRAPLEIVFDNVSFRYPVGREAAQEASGTRAIEDVNVVIKPRRHIAVVGETGSGKTTFAKLLTRLMDPSEGSVSLAGIDAAKIRFRSLRDRVVMVPQEGVLFRGTIGDNVRLGRVESTDDEIIAAFARLGLEEWLEELGQGIDTQVGERGAALSVGERQLVTLVRAAIADPEVLVLDEATSAVDPATEVRISRALGELTGGRTVVTVAHRLSTAEAADRVLVFDHARIVQDGTHQELIAEGGVYGRLFASWERGTVGS